MIIKCVTCLTGETRRRHSLIVSVRSSQHSEIRIIYGVLNVTVCRVYPSRIPSVIMNNNADNASTSPYALSVINARQTPGVKNSLFLRCISMFQYDLTLRCLHGHFTTDVFFVQTISCTTNFVTRSSCFLFRCRKHEWNQDKNNIILFVEI